MNEIIEKIIEKLEQELKLANKEKERCLIENYLQFYTAKGYANGIANTIEIIKREAVGYNNGRSSCSEQLPGEDGFYIDTLDGEIAGEDENRKWVDDEENYQCVLAWQQLPKPFQPKGE